MTLSMKPQPHRTIINRTAPPAISHGQGPARKGRDPPLSGTGMASATAGDCLPLTPEDLLGAAGGLLGTGSARAGGASRDGLLLDAVRGAERRASGRGCSPLRRTAAGRGGCCVRSWARTAAMGPSKGSRPVSNSYRITPRLYTSDGPPTALTSPLTCSGDM